MNQKIVITLILSIILVLAGYYAIVNRARLVNLIPTSPAGAPSGAASVTNGLDSAGRARKSYEILAEGSKGTPQPANANKFFFTEEQARRMGLKKYRSGPCAGSYEGEECACNPGRKEQGP